MEYNSSLLNQECYFLLHYIIFPSGSVITFYQHTLLCYMDYLTGIMHNCSIVTHSPSLKFDDILKSDNSTTNLHVRVFANKIA